VADHPATLAVVRAALDRWSGDKSPARGDVQGLRSAPHRLGVDLVALDLADLGSDDEAAARWASELLDVARPAIVVIEGVLMYLPEATVSRLLSALARVPGARVRLVASWMVAESGQPIGFGGESRMVARWLRSGGEPMLWGSSAAELPAFVSRAGWSGVRLIELDADPLAGAARGGLAGERLVTAERAGGPTRPL
jgi:leucine carboxyl methyltransferase